MAGHTNTREAAPRRRLAWVAAAWLVAIVVLSAIASMEPYLLLQWTRRLPGRDKTGHFLMMGGFAAVSVLAFAGRRLAARRISALEVLAVVAAIVVVEEVVQRWLPHRTFSGEDLAYSLVGVASFGAIAAFWRARGGRDRPPER